MTTEATKKKRKTARRGRGEGSIFQRTDGRWVGTLTTGCDANGKRKRRWVYGATKKEAQDKLTKLQSKRLDGTLDDAARLTVAKYLASWLETVKPTLRETTYESYDEIVRVHITPRIGGVGLAKVTPLHVRSILAEMEKAELSPRRQQYVRAVLR